MRNRILFSFLAWVAVIVSVQGKQKDFVLQSGRPVAIACSGSEAPVVRTSLTCCPVTFRLYCRQLPI